jgi:hypothetical protein
MSKEAYSHYLLEVKQEYTKQLSNLLVPVIYEGLISIYNEAKRTNNESSMKVFQILLSRIPNWNQNIVEGEYQRILQKTQCDWLNDLITAVFISHAKILSSIKRTNKNKTLNLKVPNGEYFIHKSYIECARQFWKNPYLFYDDVQTVNTIEFQRNMREIELIIEQSIQESVRKLLPVRDILQQYIKLDEDSSESSEDSSEDKPKKNKEEEKAKYHEEYITSNIPSRDKIKLEKSVRREISKAVRENPDNNFSHVSVSHEYQNAKKKRVVGGEKPEAPEETPIEPPPAIVDVPEIENDQKSVFIEEPISLNEITETPLVQNPNPILDDTIPIPMNEMSASELLSQASGGGNATLLPGSSIPDVKIDDNNELKDFFSNSNEKQSLLNDNVSMNTLIEQMQPNRDVNNQQLKIDIDAIPNFNEEPIPDFDFADAAPKAVVATPEVKTVIINHNKNDDEVRENKPIVSKTVLAAQKRDIKKNYSFF